METTLRAFYWRAVPLILFLAAVVFLLMLITISVAFAQDAAQAAPESSTKDTIDLIFSSVAAGAASILAVILAQVARLLPKWAGPIFDAITTSEAARWEQLQTAAIDKAEAYARSKFDALKDRNGFVNAMATFLATYNREIVEWADKDGNGIIDLIEGRLPPSPNAPEAPQAFLRPVPGAPKARASDEALARLASKRGVTKQ